MSTSAMIPAATSRRKAPGALAGAVLALCVVALLAAAGPASADDSARAFLRCMQLGDDAERLACYDRLAQEVVEVGLAGAGRAGEVPARAAETPAAATGAARAPGAPARERESRATPESLFGMESRAPGREVESIEARVIGGFTGWSGGTRFELDNGQVWLQTGLGRFDYGGQDRPVVIRRAALDSFMLSPEGLNRSVRVRRIE